MSNDAKNVLAYGVGGFFTVVAVIVGLWGFGWIWNHTVGDWLDWTFNDSRVNQRNAQLADECRKLGYRPYQTYPGVRCDVEKKS